MNLSEIVNRNPNPEPWSEGEKIPWDDSGFSERMLQEHLSQEHDAASRRRQTIDAQVDWIFSVVMGGKPGSVLDLGCGPGLYTSRLAERGCRCLGIDISPASIAYAHAQATEDKLDCRYILGDIRTANLGKSHDLAMLIFGEFNVFRRDDAGKILARVHRSLKPGGRLLIEAHTVDAVEAIGKEGTAWQAVASGLFSDRPHLRLEESFWDAERQVATTRYYIIDAGTCKATRHASSMQAYSDDQYRDLLNSAGFQLVEAFGSLTGDSGDGEFAVLVAEPR